MKLYEFPGYLVGAAALVAVPVVVVLALGQAATRPPVVAPEPAPEAPNEASHVHAPVGADTPVALTLPSALAGKAEVLTADDPDYARAKIENAEKPAGDGGLLDGLVIRVTADLPVYRMWNGPDVKNAQGYTNRLGEYWAYDQPTGTVEQYRIDYEVCTNWNQLTWVATCVLKPGAVVAIGPGQSVAPGKCTDPQESYPVNLTHWQTYVANAFARPTELDCSDTSKDFKVDPDNISEPAKG